MNRLPHIAKQTSDFLDVWVFSPNTSFKHGPIDDGDFDYSSIDRQQVGRQLEHVSDDWRVNRRRMLLNAASAVAVLAAGISGQAEMFTHDSYESYLVEAPLPAVIAYRSLRGRARGLMRGLELQEDLVQEAGEIREGANSEPYQPLHLRPEASPIDITLPEQAGDYMIVADRRLH